MIYRESGENESTATVISVFHFVGVREFKGIEMHHVIDITIQIKGWY